jgi:hypothetical protein
MYPLSTSQSNFDSSPDFLLLADEPFGHIAIRVMSILLQLNLVQSTNTDKGMLVRIIDVVSFERGFIISSMSYNAHKGPNKRFLLAT